METYPKYYPLPKVIKINIYIQKTTPHWVGVVFWLVPKKCAIKNFKLPPYSSLFPPPLGKHVLQAMETSKERFIIAPQLLDVLRLLLGEKRGPLRHQSQGRKLQEFFFLNIKNGQTEEVGSLAVLGVIFSFIFLKELQNFTSQARWGYQAGWGGGCRSCCSCKSFKSFSFSWTGNSKLEPVIPEKSWR